MEHNCPKKSQYLSGKRILPKPITKDYLVTDLIEKTFNAYNAGRIKDASELIVKEYSKEDVTVGMSLAGALTPAGMASSIITLIEYGFVDWIVATGANMYHDMHYAFNLPLYEGSPNVDDCALREAGVTRIYDVLFDYENVLMETDRRLREILTRKEFQKEMGTQEFYHHLGKIMNEIEQENKLGKVCILASAYRAGVPVFTSSPGDSTIGMNVAGLQVLSDKFKLRINPSIDVNESTAIVLNSKVYEKGKTAVILVGGGSPKNFMLQTEPQIQEILRIKEVGQDYFIQITDARVDTGGLSGATPKEAVTWGKIIGKAKRENKIFYHINDGVYHTFSGIVYDHWIPNFHSFKRGKKEICAVVGQTCDSFDKISLAEHLPCNLGIGDYLYTENIGAYSTASSTKFNGFEGAKIQHVNN